MSPSDQGGSGASPVKRALSEIRRLRAEVERLRASAAEPLAVVGLAHRLPGVDSSPGGLHDALMGGLDAIREIPADRWDVDAFYDPNRGTRGRMYTKEGGFLEDVSGFDPEFFGISPYEAPSIDPQQRLLLEVTWEALEHAAIDPSGLRGSRTGVFVGIASQDYGRMALRDPEQADAYASVGTAFSVAAGRIAYFLGLHGPALSVDTACSSSLAAAHLACRSLREAESDLAVVGGVNLILSPEVTINFCQAGMLAADGRCKTFDAGADGYVRSEGCGVVILKRLSDARRDGDRVLATVRGSALNQDGRSSGITAPNGPAQEAVIRSALENGGLGPSDVGYVEAHGTGTSLGDPIEAQALGAVFGRNGRDGDLLVGSVKTNLGHLEAAAGITGLIKAVEALRHGQVPPHLHFDQPSPHIPWDRLPLKVPREATPLEPTGGVRRAGVSSFGFSGTNAHVILEEAPPQDGTARGRAVEDDVPRERPVHLLTLTAPTEEALRMIVRRYARALRETQDSFADVCFTANAGRTHFGCRLALVSETARSAADSLTRWLEDGESRGVWTGTAGERDRTTPAFIFPNAELSAGEGEESSSPMAGSDAATGPATQIALAELFRSWGVEPAVVAGSGRGHLAGARLAGALGPEDATRIELGSRATGDRESRVAAFEEALDDVTVRPSTVPFISGATGEPVSRDRLSQASFWADAWDDGGGEADAGPALRREEVTHLLVLGPDPVEGAGAASPLPTVHLEDEVTWSSVLGALARLHVMGVDPDWEAFEGGRVRSKVSLPTYPFQRRPFWLSRTKPSQPPSTTDTATESRGRSPWDAARSAARDRAGLAPLGVTVSSYAEKWDALEDLSRALGRNALVSLGAFPEGSGSATADVILDRAGIDSIYRPMVVRWLEGMAEDGVLEREGEEWRWDSEPAPVAVEPIRARAEELLSDDPALLRYVLHASSLLEGVLAGRESALETLFPDGSFDLAARLYEDAGPLRYVNGIAADALKAWVGARPAGAPVRVLEIGGGTGGTTSSLLPVLPLDRTTYDHTDVSEVFLDWAEDKFSHVPFLRTRLFDVESEPESQGIEPGSYDVVVGSNVLHAVRDLRVVLRRVRSLLAPGGLLLLVESTGHLAWHDITTGLIEGWQRFQDDLRADSPLLDPDTWHRLFEEAGFRASAASPPEDSPASVLRQHVLLAAAPGHASSEEADLRIAPDGESVSQDAAKLGASGLSGLLADAVGSERDEVVTEAVRACVMQVLRSDPDRPPSRDARLMELGLDSLMAVRLRNLLQKRLGLEGSLPSTLVFDYPTIRRISELVMSLLDGPEQPEAPPEEEAPRAPDERERRVAELSEEEVEAMLLERLDEEESP